jgi:hypothetical protein
MSKVWLNIVLTQENVVLKKPRQLMSALFNVDRSISWEENFHTCLIANVKKKKKYTMMNYITNIELRGA